MTQFVRFRTVTSDEVVLNTAHIVKVTPLVQVVDVAEGMYSTRKQFHVAGVTRLRVADGKDYDILGTLDEVQEKFEANSVAAKAAAEALEKAHRDICQYAVQHEHGTGQSWTWSDAAKYCVDMAAVHRARTKGVTPE